MTVPSPSPVFAISHLGDDSRAAIGSILHAVCGPRNGDSVFIKPNFTYPFEKPGVTTTRAFLIALVEALKDRDVGAICIGEGEGGYNAFSMDDTFRSFGLEDLKRRYGINYVNVNTWPAHHFNVGRGRHSYSVPFPKPVLEFDSYISVPVPKVHCMTTISGAVKNQWGLIQDTMRLRLHCAFEPIVHEIVGALDRGIAISDGTFGLTRNGPMVDGETLDLGWVAGSNDLWLHDLMMCHLMRIPVSKVAHLEYAVRQGTAPDLSSCHLSPGWTEFVDTRFYLQRNGWNRLAKLAWHSPAINHLIYTSRASGALHKAMYTFRGKSPDLLARGVDWK